MTRHLIATAAALALFLGTPALPTAHVQAASTKQPAPQGQQGPLVKLKGALEQLDLSAGQKQDIKEIITAARTKIEGLKSGTTGGGLNKTQVRQIVKTATGKVIAVLTPEQKTKLKQLLKPVAGTK